MSEIEWSAVWASVAEQPEVHRAAGLELLLTEDVLRFAAVVKLVESGVRPGDLVAEWRRPGSQVPREPRETNAAWPQHVGDALKDFYRLATLPHHVEQRFSVQLWSLQDQCQTPVLGWIHSRFEDENGGDQVDFRARRCRVDRSGDLR